MAVADAKLKRRWRVWRFEEIAVNINDRVDDPSKAGADYYVGLEHLDSDCLAITRWGSPSDVTATKLRFRAGDVIFGRRRAYQRKLAIAHFDGVCSAHAMVVRARPEVVLPEFLPFFMQSDTFMERAKAISVGSLSPTINWTTLAVQEFALPPVEEQRRIADLLAAVAESMAALRESLRLATNLECAFCREVIARLGGPVVVTVGSIAKFASGKQIRVSSLSSNPTAADSVPVYGGNGISGHTSSPMPDCQVPTVVIGRVGQFCGATCMTIGPAWITDNALYPKVLTSDVDVRYLAICLRGLQLNRGKLGQYLPLITQAVVHACEIPVPSRSKQLEVISQHSDMEALARSLSGRTAQVMELRRVALDLLAGGDAKQEEGQSQA
jgi:type I restriction enzyme S subunit